MTSLSFQINSTVKFIVIQDEFIVVDVQFIVEWSSL